MSQLYCIGMFRERASRRVTTALISLLLTAAVLFSMMLAVSPALHQLLHNDANQASHECVVTLLQKQHVSADSPGPLLLGFTPTFGFSAPCIATPALSQFDYSSAPGRGPPAVLL